MKKILILQGLPASGKSTYAKKLLAEENSNWIRLNKDDARQQYFNGKWTPKHEDFVLEMRDFAICIAMLQDYDIIVDDTNFSQKHIKSIEKNVDMHNNHLLPRPTQYKVEIKYFDVSLEEAVERDSHRDKPVGRKVIEEMYNQFVKGKL